MAAQYLGPATPLLAARRRCLCPPRFLQTSRSPSPWLHPMRSSTSSMSTSPSSPATSTARPASACSACRQPIPSSPARRTCRTSASTISEIAATITDVIEDATNRTRFGRRPARSMAPSRPRYRVPIDATAPPIARPQYEMRTTQGSFSASANAFLLLPADGLSRRPASISGFLRLRIGRRRRVELRRRRSDQRRGAAVGTPRLGLLYGRPARRVSCGRRRSSVPSAGATIPAMESLRAGVAELHGYYGTFFGYTPPSFGVFGRTNERNPGQRIGLTDSQPSPSTARPSRTTCARCSPTKCCTWSGRSTSRWTKPAASIAPRFGEGLAVYYQRPALSSGQTPPRISSPI